MSRSEDDLIRRTRRVVLATVALLACALVGSLVWWRLHLSYDDGGKEPPIGRRSTERVPEDITITVER